MKKIFSILFLFLAISASSQIRIYQRQNSFGFENKRGIFDSSLHIPQFAGTPDLMDEYLKYSAVAADTLNHVLYYYDGSTQSWSVVGSGGGGGTTIQSVQYATAGQVAFTFASVPASYADYDIYLNGDPMVGAVDFTTSGNVVTFTYPLFLNDQVIYRRKK